MGITNFKNGVSSFGMPVLPLNGFASQGNIIFVKPSSGSDGVSLKSNTPQRAFKTLEKALSVATADKNDIVFLIAESNTAASTTDYQSAAFDWNKDGVHLIGVNAGSMLGQRSRIAQLSTVLTVEDLFTVSADGCMIANIEVFQGVASSTATSPRAAVVSGMRNRFVNCQLSGCGDTGGSMDTAGARSLAVTGAENTFQHCYIGLNTVIRGTMTTEVYATTGARNIFESCMIDSYTSLSTFKAFTAGAPDRFVLFKDCIFNAVQNITSAVAPTGAIASGSVNGSILVMGGGVFGYADVTTADDTKTLILTHGALAANIIDMGVAKGTDVA